MRGKNGVGGVADAVVLVERIFGQGGRGFEDGQGFIGSACAEQNSSEVVDVIKVVVVDLFDRQVATGSGFVEVLDRCVIEQVLAVKVGNDPARIQLAFFDKLFEVFKHATEHIVSTFVMGNKDHADPRKEAVVAVEVFVVKQ